MAGVRGLWSGPMEAKSRLCFHFCCLIVVALWCSAAQLTHAEASCPDLLLDGNLPTGYAWALHNNLDFYIYRAGRAGDDSSGIGIYFGYWPDFHPPENATRAAGEVAGKQVSWVVRDGSPEVKARHYRETLFEYQPVVGCVPLKVHVWLFAQDTNQVEELLGSLKSIRFRNKDSQAEGSKAP